MKDFLRFVRRPSNLLDALRKITVGGVIAATGVTPTPTAAAEQNRAPQLQTPTIVDRSRKVAKLILRLPGGGAAALSANHRSHRSHSSHRSHYSSSGGGGAAPVTPRPTPPPAKAAPLDLADTTSVSGEITTIDRVNRTLTVRQSTGNTSRFAYRDDSTFESALGVNLRFDEFADTNGGLPVAVRDKVQVIWRTSTDGKTQIVTNIKKTR